MATPNKQKRKQQTITLEEKQSIIETSKRKPKTFDLVKHFNNKYGESTIRTIIKNKDKILEAIDEGAGGKRARLKGAKHSDVEEALLKWLKDVRSENVAVDGPTLKVSFEFLACLVWLFRQRRPNWRNYSKLKASRHPTAGSTTSKRGTELFSSRFKVKRPQLT